MSEHIINVSDASFSTDVLGAEGPVLVDFWAAWCGPCKMIAPVLNEIADEFVGKITVAKMDVEENNKTPGELGIRGIPTLMIFNKGEVVATKVGAVSKAQLEQFVNENI